MTRNQILYQEFRERNRSNLANELLTKERDAETARANLAREAETSRANRAREGEDVRSHLASELETRTHNRATESETALHNRNTELETNRSNLAKELETNRANLAREAETERNNREHEANVARGQDLGYLSDTYDVDVRRETANKDRASREAIAVAQNEVNKLIAELAESGKDRRQLIQIGSDAIKVLHDDIVDLISSDQGQTAIRRLIDEYYYRQIGR